MLVWWMQLWKSGPKLCDADTHKAAHCRRYHAWDREATHASARWVVSFSSCWASSAWWCDVMWVIVYISWCFLLSFRDRDLHSCIFRWKKQLYTNGTCQGIPQISLPAIRDDFQCWWHWTCTDIFCEIKRSLSKILLDISFAFYLGFIPSTLKAFLKAGVILWPWWLPLCAEVYVSFF
jgi:hypothetical protein